MKHPPLLPMPSSVQNWLDAQLEARGIDATKTYTQYILSLLQRETPLPITTLPHGPKKCGIEKLVDDLCGNPAGQEDAPYYAAFSSLDKQQPVGPTSPASTVWSPAAEQVVGSDQEAWTTTTNKNNMTQRRLYLRQDSPKRTLDDTNLAQLIAKFDESIEALWSPEADKSSPDTTDYIQELPVDIQQLLASPSDDPDGKQANSFIPCGTNITSSIWSDCNDDSNMDTTTEDDAASYHGFHSRPDAELRSNIEWNKCEISPSLFTSLPFGLSYALGDLTQNLSSHSKWSDFEGSSGSLRRYLATGEESFVALNHNKEDSSFTEVVPKTNTDGAPVVNSTVLRSDSTEVDQEDEDLLTSARTHFKPIKQESTSQSIRGYADGTTFVIPDGLEVLPFKRSQSGMLYLESEARLETPAKYREYKEKEPYGGRCGSSDVGTEFIPKFKVCPNEKYCQTDTADDLINHFFFPGDEQLADSSVECPSEDEERGMYDEKSWQMSRAWGDEQCQCSNSSDIWSDNHDCDCDAYKAAMNQGWNGKDLQHNRLREELSQDGEQLLSDLSYMQHLFLGSDWLEDNSEQPMTDWDDDNRPSAQKFQCISPLEDIEETSGSPRSLPGKHLAKDNSGGRFEVKSVDDFFSNCLLNVLPKTILLSVELEAKWKLNQRLFNAKVNPKDRKRRHSVSQRTVPRDLTAAVTRRSQTSCVNGITCPQFILNHARVLRPVTL